MTITSQEYGWDLHEKFRDMGILEATFVIKPWIYYQKEEDLVFEYKFIDEFRCLFNEVGDAPTEVYLIRDPMSNFDLATLAVYGMMTAETMKEKEEYDKILLELMGWADDGSDEAYPYWEECLNDIGRKEIEQAAINWINGADYDKEEIPF